MEDRPPAQQADVHPPHHHHHHLQQHHHHPHQHLLQLHNHLNLTRLQSPKPGYTSATCKPASDPLLEPAGNGAETPNSFLASSASWRGGPDDAPAGRGLQRAGRNGPNQHVDAGEHPDRGWSDDDGGANEAWDGRGGCGGSASEFYGRDDYCRYADRVTHERNGGGEAAYETDADGAFPGSPLVFYGRDAFRQGSVDGEGDGQPGLDRGYPGRFEDPGSGFGEGPEGGEGDWRGVDGGEGSLSILRPPAGGGGRYTEKLDSFSEAFQPYRRGRGLPAAADADPAGRHGMFDPRLSWDVDPGAGGLYSPSLDSYVPTHPFFPSLPSLPPLLSPPHPSQFMPSVLSPPPTPLPPSSLSPSQGECPFGTSAGRPPALRDGDDVQFFPVCVPSQTPAAGLIWKLPGLPHCYPQQSCDRAIAEGNHRVNHGNEVNGLAEHQTVLMAPESSFISSSPLTPSFPTPSPLHPAFHPAHLVSFHQRKEGRVTSCPPQAPEGPSGPPGQSCSKNGTPLAYKETPFPSMLHRREDGQRQGHYTPRPILNPVRQGAGLHCSIASLIHGPQEMVRGGDVVEGQYTEPPRINVGPDFQAELPACSPEGEESRRPAGKGPVGEQLLWKPFAVLEESVGVQDQVERLLAMCNSSCLPGGGANTELALHCLHFCNGDTLASLDRLLFSLHAVTGDYHYSGSDSWSEQERAVFSQGLRTLGKDFSLIQNMVRTKSVRQCVEFYYLGKRLSDMQQRQADRERELDAADAIDQQVASSSQPMRTLPGLERAVPATPLATIFPCKMCGKMFYKIKSRNAHMKIHRQPQEDWSERRLQPQLLAHRLNASHGLAPNLGPALLLPQASPRAYPFPGLTLPSNNSSGHPDSGLNLFDVNNDSNSGSGGAHAGNMRVKSGLSTLAAFSNMGPTNPHDAAGGGVSDSAANQRGPPSVPSPVHQSWPLWTG